MYFVELERTESLGQVRCRGEEDIGGGGEGSWSG